MNALSLLGSTLGLGFAAGLNIYATVLVEGFLFDRLSWKMERKQQTFHFFKHRFNHGQEVFQILQKAKNEQTTADFRLADAAL
jgi:hypothetical protein